MTALYIQKGQSVGSWTDAHIEQTLEGLANKRINEKLRLIKFESCLLSIIEDIIPSVEYLTMIVNVTLHNRNFIFPVAIVVKKKGEKAIDVRNRTARTRTPLSWLEYRVKVIIVEQSSSDVQFWQTHKQKLVVSNVRTIHSQTSSWKQN